jgi:photosystem II stability/assembly factor-like uncharacterized protein
MQPFANAGKRGLVLAAAAIAALTLAACGSAAAPGTPEGSNSATSSGPASNPASSPATSPPSSTPIRQELIGFRALSMTFVSDQQGWALGTVKCGTARCLALLGTTDGGSSWQELTAPTMHAGGVYSTCPAGTPCVQQIRFATPQIGYAYDPSLLTTTDGGSTWQQQTGTNVSSLEAADGTVVRVISNSMGCSGTKYRVQSAAVGSASWHTLSTMPFSQICPPVLYRQGERLVLAAYGNPAGGVRATAQIGRSMDGGASWAIGLDKCGGKSGYASGVALAPPDVLVLLCQDQAPGAGNVYGPAWVRVSTNGGATYGPDKTVPSVVPGTIREYQVAAASSRRLLVVETGQHGSQVMLTENGGASWSSTLGLTAGLNSAAKVILVGYQDPLTCRIAAGDKVWTTGNGGQAWQQQQF